MRTGRYRELLSKIDTDLATDEDILKKLQDYRYNDEVNLKYGHDAQIDRISRNYGNSKKGPITRIMPKVSILRQALPSLAFLLLLVISVYGLVSGLNKNSNNGNSDQSASLETTLDTGKSPAKEAPVTDKTGSVKGEVSKSPNSSNDGSDHVSSVSVTIGPETNSDETSDPGVKNPGSENSETENPVTDNSGSDNSESINSGAENSGSTDSSVPETSDHGNPDSSDGTDTLQETAGSSNTKEESDDISADTSDEEQYIVTVNNAETVNTSADYYKNEVYREDLKFYIRYNGASKVKSLFIQSLGSVSEKNYTVEGNIITIRKEYLDTLPDGYYDLNINMNKGNPATARFTVHPEDEESEYGFYRLSHYYWDFYLSDPKDFTFLVFNRKDARITGLRNGSVPIDPGFYELDENGYVATLSQDYMADREEGIRFNLIVEFSDGMEKTIGIKIRYKELSTPYVNPVYSTFDKSKPEDVVITILWNDAKYITSIDPETRFSVGLSSNDYMLQNNKFTIKKEFLKTLEAGEYIWYFMFDTETGAEIHIKVND